MTIKRIGSIAARVVAVGALLLPGVYGRTLTDQQKTEQSNELTDEQKAEQTKKLMSAIRTHAEMSTERVPGFFLKIASVEEKEQAWKDVVAIVDKHKKWSIMTYEVGWSRGTPVEFAFEYSYFEAFEYMIRSGVDPDFIPNHKDKTFAHQTVLHHVDVNMDSDEKWFEFLVVEKFKFKIQI